ncbi:MAG: phage holin family protein [Chitinophagaceae bacterium]
MKAFLSRTLISSLAVLIAAYVLSGVHVENTLTAIFVAAVLGLLNSFIKPILIVLTLPITLLSMGLFLLVINIFIVKWAADIVPGFSVDDWLTALFFSLIVSFITSIIEGFIRKQEAQNEEN